MISCWKGSRWRSSTCRNVGYATDLRSATQGRATFTMEPLKYSEVPANVAEALINKG